MSAGVAFVVSSGTGQPVTPEHGVATPLTTLNPAIDLDRLGLRVPRSCVPLGEIDGVTRAAVNSFGFGGTNAHAVLEAAPIGPWLAQQTHSDAAWFRPDATPRKSDCAGNSG